MRRPSDAPARWGTIITIVLAFAGTTACHAAGAPPAESAPVTPGAAATPVSAEDFPRAAHLALLSHERTVAEKLRLSGIVQHQLGRASRLFLSGHEREAEDAVVGALLLLRQDDAVEAALNGQDHPLLLAAHAAARRGDTGRAAAFYRRVLLLQPSKQVQEDVEQHLEAMQTFRQASSGSSPVLRAGEGVRHDLSFATVDPSESAYASAREAILRWMQISLESAALSRNPESMSDREEAIEAYQAIRAGAPAMLSLCLRQGEPLRAVEVLEEANLGRALPRGARGLLLEAGKKNDPEAWLQLFQLLDGARRSEGAEGNLPPYLADAGVLWASLGLYRASPGQLQHAMPLAMMLLEFGMPEVATTLLAQTVGADTSPEALAWSLSLALRAMLELGRTDQIEAARVSFREAHKLLELAKTKLPEDAESASSLHLMLANLEIRFGNAQRALPLLTEASDQHARASTWLRLAEVTQQVQGADAAVVALDRAIRAAQMQGDVLSEARVAELRFALERARGNSAEAASALEVALKRALTARAMDLPQVPTGAIERLLARVLEDYGKLGATRRAYARALEASRHNLDELSFTLTEMARSGLATGDVRLSREATRQALDLNLEHGDLIYIALWQWLGEQRAGGHLDQLPRTALAGATEARGWAAQLRLFGLGQTDSQGLLAAAKTATEKTEAEFYVALQTSAPEVRKAALEKVAASPAIDLVEVHLAKDLLAPRLDPPWPADVELP